MNDIADPRTHDDAFVAALVAAGLVVGDGTDPTEPHGWRAAPGQSEFIAYVIVYPLTAAFDGGLACSFNETTFAWQVTCVAETRERCDWLRHRVDQAVIGRELTVAGRSVPLIRPDGGTGTRPENRDGRPQLFLATPRYTATSV